MLGKTIIAAAAFVAVAYGAACESTEFTKLLPVASDPNVAPCAKESGFNLIPPTGLPNDDQLKIMCGSAACKGVIDAVKKTSPSDCDLTVGKVTLNVFSLVNNFPNDCQRVAGTPAPAPGPAPTTAPAPGPAPTTAPAPGPTPTTTPGPAPTTAPAPGPAPTTTPSPVDNSC